MGLQLANQLAHQRLGAPPYEGHLRLADENRQGQAASILARVQMGEVKAKSFWLRAFRELPVDTC